MLAALNANGTTLIKAKKSRNHSELLFKYLKIPIKIKKTKKYDFISIQKPKKIKPFNYKIPGDISSSARPGTKRKITTQICGNRKF